MLPQFAELSEAIQPGGAGRAVVDESTHGAEQLSVVFSVRAPPLAYSPRCCQETRIPTR